MGRSDGLDYIRDFLNECEVVQCERTLGHDGGTNAACTCAHTGIEPGTGTDVLVSVIISASSNLCSPRRRESATDLPFHLYMSESPSSSSPAFEHHIHAYSPAFESVKASPSTTS